MPQLPHDDGPRTAAKLRKLETCESLAMLQGPLLDQRSSDAASIHTAARDATVGEPLMLGLAIRRGRLGLLTVAAVAAVIAATLAFSGGGVVIETFERRDVSIKQQEKLLEKYNAYSGSITAAIERPVELYAALVVQVVVLRLMAADTLDVGQRWRGRVVVVALGAVATYLLANGLSAVNVQVRERPMELVISAEDLTVQVVDPATVSTVQKSYPEDRAGNTVTNTVLRNLLLPRATESQTVCSDRNSMDDVDEVVYRLQQHAWMRDLLPTALEPRSMQIEIAAKNTAANAALTPDQFPMNASVAADLLMYSWYDPFTGNGWGGSNVTILHKELAQTLAREQTKTEFQVPVARLTPLLPPTLKSTELEDREWFLKNSGPSMYNVSSVDYRNASLRSWNMTFSHVDIVPGTVWVDALTVEREMASPRLQTNTSKDGNTRFYALDYGVSLSAPLRYKFIPKAGGAIEDRIDAYRVCGSDDGSILIPVDLDVQFNISTISCPRQSNNSLLVVSRGMRLIADAVVENATVQSGELVVGKGDGVIVNMREVFSVTVARITWQLQDLAVAYNARCDAKDGCMGLDVPLAGGQQRLVVGASVLPLRAAPPIIRVGEVSIDPLELVTLRRPKYFHVNSRVDTVEAIQFIGDILLPHNIRNASQEQASFSDSCVPKFINRLNTYVNNHLYIENTLQTAYTAAASLLFQSGVARDVVNQTWTASTMLAFSKNTQNVDVYVYIPWLNVMLTLGGCVLLVVIIVIVVFWPQVGLRGKPDPLAHITTPHSIATVMLNETAFPPLLLTRSVAHTEQIDARIDNANDFSVKTLFLQHKNAMRDNDGSHATTGESQDRPTVQIDP